MKAPLLAAAALAAAAQSAFAVTGGPDRADPVSYAVGDEVVWTFRADAAPAPGSPIEWRWTVSGDGPAATGSAPFVQNDPLVFSSVFSSPGFLRASATLVDAASGRPLRAGNGLAAGVAAAGASIGEMPMPEEPADFDAFWADAKAEVEDPALPGGSLVPPPPGTAPRIPGFRISAFHVPLGHGRMPATGWVAWPSGASERSLPMTVRFVDYGLGPEAFPPDFDRGGLFVLVHPHGFPADWDRKRRIEAFDGFSNGGHGGSYGFRDEENADPRTCYFRGMVQRGVASVRFARTLPMWDGEHVTFVGRGQGAFQAVACAAVGGGATECRITAPWLCGLGLDSSWQPVFQPALRYFDAVNLARRVRCRVRIEADLADSTHAPAGAARLFAALAGPRELVFRGRDGKTVSTLSAGD